MDNKKLIGAVAAVFIVICGWFAIRDYDLPVYGKKFQSVELIYENRVEEKGVNDRYYYKRLSNNAKIAYTLIVPEIPKHTERIEIPKLNDEELDALMYAISYDNPELICYGKDCQLISEGSRHYFVPSYTHSAEQHEAYTAALENLLVRLSSKLYAGNDYEKELFIHDYICQHCKYLNDGSDLRTSAYDALILGEAVCEGYARATQLLLNRAGVHNYLVTGDARNPDGATEGHMWNVVTIDGQNYYLDVTWDDFDKQNVTLEKCYFYFNVNQELIDRDHFSIEPSADNGCNSLFSNYYSSKNSLFHSYDSVAKGALQDNAVRNVQNGDYTAEMMFTNHEAYEKMKQELLDTGDVLSVIENINSRQSKKHFYKVEYEMFDSMDYIRFVFS